MSQGIGTGLPPSPSNQDRERLNEAIRKDVAEFSKAFSAALGVMGVEATIQAEKLLLAFDVVGYRSGVLAIMAERIKQVQKLGFTPEKDENYRLGELAYAAVAYALPEGSHYRNERACRKDCVRDEPIKLDRGFFWPWLAKTFKPNADDRIRELAKAGALIAAEIDRLMAARDAEKEQSAN